MLILGFMLMLLFRMVAFFQKSIFVWFTLCATSVLHCHVCSSVVPRYLYCLTCVSRCPFTFTSHCFSCVFSTIIVFAFLAFIAIPYCSQVASILSIICWCCCSLSPSMIVSSAYLMFVIFCPLMFIPSPSSSASLIKYSVYVEQTRWQYTTLSNPSLYCHFFRCLIFISHCGFLLEVKTFDYGYFFVWYSGFR